MIIFWRLSKGIEKLCRSCLREIKGNPMYSPSSTPVCIDDPETTFILFKKSREFVSTHDFNLTFLIYIYMLDTSWKNYGKFSFRHKNDNKETFNVLTKSVKESMISAYCITIVTIKTSVMSWKIS